MNSINELAAKAAANACTEWQDLHRTDLADLSRFEGFLLTHINKMVDSFFEAYPWEIDETRKTKLFNHRLNQAIVAVSCFLERTTPGVFEFSNEEDFFSLIDRQVQSKVPTGKTVNSKARSERIKCLLPEGFEFASMSTPSCPKPVTVDDGEIYSGS
ncbi:MAG: hypothetical protein K2W94_07480 [Alphaproteobacteria bacterium]|nr:hypothetical protein [Alphaproteobacteria bacterium]